MHPHLSMHSCQPGLATASRLQLQRHGSRVVSRAMPLQLPNAGQLSRKFNPLPGPQPTKPQQPQQQPNHSQNHISADGTSYSTQVVSVGTAQQPVPAAPVPIPGNSSTGLSLKFAKHLANVSNGCAPPTIRFESLGWLLFESKRLQASLTRPSLGTVDSWLCSADSMQLLEQIYLVGAAIADLGTADGLQPLSSSNGSRAIVSLDYSRLLERYLQQHGHLLAEEFWSQLHAYDDLQARAIHVATALETRCMVHAMLFDKLIERVGTESSAAAARGSGSWSAQGSAPLATAITNTMINTTQQHSAPVTSQSTVATPSAVNSNSGNNSNSATGVQPAVHGVWGWLGQLGAVFLLVCTIAGKVVQIVIAVVSFAKDVVVQLLMLRAVSAGAKAVAAKAAGRAQLQPAFAGAAALPADDALQPCQLPGAVGAHSAGVLQPSQPVPVAAAAAAAPAIAAGTAVRAAASAVAGALTATPLPTATQQQLKQPLALAAELQLQQQQAAADSQQLPGQQGQAPTPAAEPVAQSLATDGLQEQRAQQPQQPQAQAVASSAARAHAQQPPRRKSMRSGLRAGLKGGLGAAAGVLSKAAAKVSATAASIPTVLQQAQQQLPQQMGVKHFKAGSGNLLYSLWSPAEAGLHDMEVDATAGVQFADAGWGVTGSSAAAAVHTTEEGW